MKAIVYRILDKTEATRNNDYVLYAWVCNEMGVDLSMSLGEFLFKTTEIPNFKTVERCRRKWEEKHSELVDKKTKQARVDEEEKYIEISRE